MNPSPLTNKLETFTLNTGRQIELFRPESVKEAVIFYLKYKGNMRKFNNDFPQVFQRYMLHGEGDFSRWLFNLSFKDVIAEEKP